MQTRHAGTKAGGCAAAIRPAHRFRGARAHRGRHAPAMPGPAHRPAGTGLVLLCLLLLLSACHRKPPAEEVRPVRSVMVEPGPDRNAEVMTGQVAAHRSINLAFRLPGKVVERAVSAGSTVHAGDVLARLDDTVPQQTLRTALAENATAKAALEQAAP
ncbi:biotin/lipoyl-binding protein [Komagataeibacter rhaeticus]|nr:biotin/lipoyl-binding protein [Komagataeibacter rhaeticus]